ncbi:two-component regulator propeller domain-containing protein [Marivirga atlantica]|jgi:ligand-binding sensor domain-containing protein|uniref:PorZ N-terminal beta-propeller domain-containing protein n=1 Tax=Marivirga atlantica TaxID=1548457 RepID=A0A937AEM5_9BACT|nr:hypothetical protein [Marivirga atlantica]MBL0764214.1 hypothetical protein [Marivirga atlantica]
MLRVYSGLIILNLLLCTNSLSAQNIPIGNWRSHVDYSNAKSITVFDHKIFCMTDNGLFYYDPEDESINTLQVQDGLSDINPTDIFTHEPTDQLFISYKSGIVDVIDKDFNILSFTDIANSDIIESKAINSISADTDNIYLSADFGVVILDAKSLQINDSYINLSRTGEPLAINQLSIVNDLLYLATPEGLLIGESRNDTNLKDFRNWSRTNVDSTTKLIKTAFFDEQLFTLTEQGEVYTFVNGTWSRINSIPNNITNIYFDDASLKASEQNQVYGYSSGSFEPELAFSVAGTVNNSLTVSSQKYVAHSTHSLAKVSGSSLQSLKPNGPVGTTESIYQLENYTIHFSTNAIGFSYFFNGRWSYVFEDADGQQLPYFKDVSIDLINETGLFLSEEEGLYIWDTEQITAVSVEDTVDVWHFTATDNLGSPWALCEKDGVYNLYNLSSSELISTGLGTNKTVKEYLIVPNGDHYLATNEGIVAFNVENEVSRILTETSGNGNLSSNRINTFELGLDGKLWIGTADGVCYFTNYFGVFENTNVDAVRPIFDGFFLFDYTAINAIAIDGGNRLWVGNRDGLWLFDKDIEENLLHFTEENSPLANETVEQIRINPFNGEAFIKSGDQLISYRTASSRANSTHSDVKVFPNPVYLNQHDQVSINGLVFNNEIMITDLAGNLVYKGAANGGTFNWNLQNYSGFITKPGIYLVFSVDTFGEETYQTKFVVSN